MGVYSEYLSRKFAAGELSKERKTQLQRIAQIRKRDVLVIAANLERSYPGASNGIDYSDIAPVKDQLDTLQGKELDVIIETPGGIAEVTENIVRMIRKKYEKVGMIIPGWAKSAGTIFAMAGDEILMGESSALGPIDPQIGFGNGRRFSADAVIEGFERIKNEVLATGRLNPAYMPILQQLSPGEIQNCINASKFGQELVKGWLCKFKFKFWDKRKSTGLPVTEEYKQMRATEIAVALSDHARWLTHGRSIMMDDLTGMGLIIHDYTTEPDLHDAINRYHTLLRMTFEAGNVYKIYETPTAQILKRVARPAPPPPLQQIQLQGPIPPQPGDKPAVAEIPHTCSKCGKKVKIQYDLMKGIALQPGNIPYPAPSDILKCECGHETNLSRTRQHIEEQAKLIKEAS